MTIVFLFLGLLIILATIITLFLISTIKIKIENLKVDTTQKPILNDSLILKIQLYVFKKLKFFSITLDRAKLKMIYKKIKEKHFDEVVKQRVSKEEVKKSFKKINIDLENLDLKVGIGIAEDAPTTAILVGVISSIIGIGVGRIANPQNCHFQVIPVYFEGDLIKISLDSIICVKMVHIIYNIYFMMKGRKEDDRTSNRKFNEYSYERH